MNVFLMYPDRNFEEVQGFPMNAEDLMQDLELEILLNAMAQGDDYLYADAKKAVFSPLDSPDVIRYRQEVLKDCLKNPQVIREIYHIPIQAIEAKHRNWLGIFGNYPGSILSGAREMLEMFVELLKLLRKIVDENEASFESPGFRRFFGMIQQELNDDYLALVSQYLKELKFPYGILVSAELGKGNEGTNYVLRKPNNGSLGWVKRVFRRGSPLYSMTLHPRDDHGARALGELRERAINDVANALAQSASHIESFLNVMRKELAFYIGCLNLHEQVAPLGEPIAFPEIFMQEERKHSFVGLYDICLALTKREKITGNDVNADGKEMIIITGANQGGKSTFLRSLGIAQMMMQCGMYVPAERFSANLCCGIFTHYRREEDADMKSGKFDEELKRMSDIIDAIKPNSLLLFNESFAATNEREGSEVARQIVSALLERGIKIFFVTHLYAFARGFFNRGKADVLFLVAEVDPTGMRTYRCIEGEPLDTSFGVDIYREVFGIEKKPNHS